MKDVEPRGAVHWIDHYVVGTNDLSNWADWANKATGLPLRPINGLTTNMRKKNTPIFCFMWWDGGSCRIGAFLQPENYPPAKELGKDMPRCGFYIRPEDIGTHLRRLDQHKIVHSEPSKDRRRRRRRHGYLLRRSGRQSIRVLGAGAYARRRHGDRHRSGSRAHQPRGIWLAGSCTNCQFF